MFSVRIFIKPGINSFILQILNTYSGTSVIINMRETNAKYNPSQANRGDTASETIDDVTR